MLALPLLLKICSELRPDGVKVCLYALEWIEVGCALLSATSPELRVTSSGPLHKLEVAVRAEHDRREVRARGEACYWAGSWQCARFEEVIFRW